MDFPKTTAIYLVAGGPVGSSAPSQDADRTQESTQLGLRRGV
jgi:hypothetical protein